MVRGDPVSRKEDCSQYDIGLVFKEISSYSDQDKVKFLENVWKPGELFDFPVSVEGDRGREPGRTGGGRGTGDGRRKGGRRDLYDGGKRERNSKRQAFACYYCLLPVEEMNPGTFS